MGALMEEEEESEQEAGQESAGRLRDAIEQREESKRIKTRDHIEVIAHFSIHDTHTPHHTI